MEQAQLVIGVTLGISAILGLLAGLIRKTVKYYLSELKPDGNGGHNLRGRIDRTEARVEVVESRTERIETRVDRIYELLIEDKLSK